RLRALIVIVRRGRPIIIGLRRITVVIGRPRTPLVIVGLRPPITRCPRGLPRVAVVWPCVTIVATVIVRRRSRVTIALRQWPAIRDRRGQVLRRSRRSRRDVRLPFCDGEKVPFRAGGLSRQACSPLAVARGGVRGAIAVCQRRGVAIIVALTDGGTCRHEM